MTAVRVCREGASLRDTASEHGLQTHVKHFSEAVPASLRVQVLP